MEPKLWGNSFWKAIHGVELEEYLRRLAICDEHQRDCEKYACCVHYAGDTTPCSGDISIESTKCLNPICNRLICKSCAETLNNPDLYCTACHCNFSKERAKQLFVFLIRQDSRNPAVDSIP